MSNLQSTGTNDVIILDQFSSETRIAARMFERLSAEEQDVMLQLMRQLANENNVESIA